MKLAEEAFAVAAAIARSQEFAPGTVVGSRQAWLRESIARRIEGAEPEVFVTTSDVEAAGAVAAIDASMQFAPKACRAAMLAARAVLVRFV